MTYVIDPDGIVRHIVDAPRDFARHPEEALQHVQALATQ